jgi:hypothetical protein
MRLSADLLVVPAFALARAPGLQRWLARHDSVRKCGKEENVDRRAGGAPTRD